MNSFITILCILFSFISYAQTPNNISNDILSVKTNKHVNIPGTRVFVIPPIGFTVSKTYPAIEKRDEVIVQSLDLIGGSFYTNAATFSKEKFEKKGIKVFEYKEFKINNFPAKMAFVQGEPAAKVYNLVFGDSTFSAMIMGVFATNDHTTGEQIKNAIQSVYYDKTFVINPFAAANFKLDDSKSIFKFAKYSASMYVYSIDGIKKDSYDKDPYLMVSTLSNQGAALQHTADDIASVLKNGIIKNNSTAKTNGYPSLKREICGKLNGKDAVLFQHLVSIGQHTIIMQGIADDNFEKYIVEFQKLSNTINKK